MYKVRHREEEFGYIVSFGNGWIEFYDKSAKHIIDQQQLDKLGAYQLGEGGRILEYKRQGIAPDQYYKIPKSVFESSCPLKAPIVVQIELTLKCNLACKFCFNYSRKPRENELSTTEIKDLLRQLKNMEVMSVFFTGGEATLRSDFAEILQYADSLDLDYFVLTNGTRITRDLLDEVPKRTYFVISFDGINTHKSLHGGLDFEGMRTLFDLIKEKGFPLTAQYVLQRENVDDLYGTYRWCAENRVDLAAIDLYPTGRAMHNPDIFPTDDQLPSFEKLTFAKFEYEKIQAKWEEEQEHDTATFIANPYHFTFIARLEEIFERSFSGVFFSYIASNGDVYPDNWHGGEGMFCAGNVRHRQFEDMWKDSFWQIRELVKWEKWKSCKTCPVSTSFCDYRLPVLSRNLHGDYTTCGATDFQKKVMIMRARARLNYDGVLSNDMARAIDIW
jgi:MoaA/NifB/PqqE/SkfB family radical SAM enzyme